MLKKALQKSTVHVSYMVATAISLSERLSLAGLGTVGNSISNLDILDMVPLWRECRKCYATTYNWLIPMGLIEPNWSLIECDKSDLTTEMRFQVTCKGDHSLWRRRAAAHCLGQWWRAEAQQSQGNTCTSSRWCSDSSTASGCVCLAGPTQTVCHISRLKI